MTLNPSDEKLLELLDKYCHGDMTAEEAQLLAETLRVDPAARRLFIEYFDLHHGMSWEASSAADADSNVNRLPETAVPPSHLRRVGLFFVGTRPRVAVTVAAGFLAFLLCMAAFLPAHKQRADRPADDDAIVDRVVAARITGSVDCIWQDQVLPLGFGTSLYKGQQVELLQGTAEITFNQGATVTLQGPAVYIVDSASRSSLRHGELTAAVPPGAKGFAVQTPSLTIVDLGTEFGVTVSPTKTDDEIPIEEVHVFVGVVELSVRGSDEPPRRLTRNQAVRFRAGTKLEPLDESRREQFPQPIEESGDTTTLEEVPDEAKPPVTQRLTLWLDADGPVQADSLGFVKAWEDRLIGDNTQAQNATQHISRHQPRKIPAAMGGKPAIRFDGDDVLVLGTPDSLGVLSRPYEMFIVAQSSAPSVQFLIAGGVEDFEIHFNGDSGARFIPAGFVNAEDASDVATTGTFTDGRPRLLSARVEAESTHRGILRVDGNQTGSATKAAKRSANNTALRLGLRHNSAMGLIGDIAAVLIYRGTLSASQRREVEDYLKRKYGVQAR